MVDWAWENVKGQSESRARDRRSRSRSRDRNPNVSVGEIIQVFIYLLVRGVAIQLP